MKQRSSPYDPKDEKALMTELWDPNLADDLLAWVMFAFPWGKVNTPLSSINCPRTWQCEEFDEISQHLKDNKERIRNGQLPKMYQKATVAGRGVGKSALFGMLAHWFQSTRLGASTIVTANTGGQLQSKTWPELGKWHTLALNSHWFERTTLKYEPAEWFKEAVRRDLKIDTGYYYAEAQLWSAENPDAFAGAHNLNGMMVVFDEASNIYNQIWTITEGFFTEPTENRFWLAFGNGRRNSGTFFECFHKDRATWRTRHLDARTVEGTDPEVYQRIIEKYGPDSDPARVEVYGQFPKQGDKQFISSFEIREAQTRELTDDPGAPLTMGVDVARHGMAKSVIRWRQGRDARAIPPREYKGLDNMQLAQEVADWIDKTKPDAVCIDAGNGTGVIDRLRQMHYRVHEIWFGGASLSGKYFNRRTEMWADMKDWLPGGCIDSHQELYDDLAAPEFRHMGREGKLMLEPKEEMEDRGLSSPDHGDALCLTFATKVSRRDSAVSGTRQRSRIAKGVDYDVLR